MQEGTAAASKGREREQAPPQKMWQSSLESLDGPEGVWEPLQNIKQKLESSSQLCILSVGSSVSP